MRNLVRMAHTVRHVRAKQLFARLQLMIRRKWYVRQSEKYRSQLLSESLPQLRIHEKLPAPIFEPRSELASLSGGVYELTFLNETHSFSHPIDWHPRKLEYGTRLWLLNLHYMEFLEALDDEAFVKVIEDWVKNVPPYRSGYWLDDWNSYALSIRCVVWMQQFANRSDQLGDAFKQLMLTSLVRQIRFLVRNLELDIGGNHLIKNIKALLWASSFWDIEEADEWYDIGEKLLERELIEQILPDGMHYERSPAYHTQVFADLLECFTVLREGKIKRFLQEKLRSMAQVLLDTTHPDGLVSLFNDGGLHMAYSTESCMQLWKTWTNESLKPRSVFSYEHSGYYGMNRGEDYVLVDCGKVAPDFLTAHGHGDIFSFEWTISGKRIFIDTGVFEYNSGPRREYSRSTRAHNTVTLDKMDQCEFWGAFRIAKRARVKRLVYKEEGSGFVLSGSHDGYSRLAGAPVHIRAYDVKPGRIQVFDEVKGGKGQQMEARLLLHPTCTVKEEDGGWLIQRDDVSVRLVTESQVSLERSIWYPDFGVEEACTQVVIEYGSAPSEGAFLLERVL